MTIRFERANGDYCLVVSDNGIGMSASVDEKDAIPVTTGLGHRLVRSFVAQLGGRQEIDSGAHGTTAQVCFPIPAS